MCDQSVNTENGFKKLQVADTVAFAIENIPSVDKRTLEKFLQLVHTTGTFGIITCEQLVNKMRLMMKYIPNACPHSLLVVAELLEIKTPPLPNISPTTLPNQLGDLQPSSRRLKDQQPVRLSG